MQLSDALFPFLLALLVPSAACSDSDKGGDEDEESSEPTDADGDGASAETDCDDADPSAYPGADEVCDGVDNDCDGAVDEDAVDGTTFYTDGDGDGFGAPGTALTQCEGAAGLSLTADDCDDDDGQVRPDATEVCDGVDNDCDGDVDDADATLDPSTTTPQYPDGDGDGYGEDGSAAVDLCADAPGFAPVDGDCDDVQAAVNPGATEVCDPSQTDEDCNGVADDDDSGVDPDSLTDWYADADLDGYGDPSVSTAACEGPVDMVADDTDCDDDNPDVNPAATEACNGEDDDCDGTVPADELDSDSDGCSACEGDPDDSDSSQACTVEYSIGDTSSDWTATSYFRGNAYTAYTSATLESFEVYLGLAGACEVDFYVHEASTTSGPWSVAWSGTTTASAGTDFVSSGDIDYAFTTGMVYGLGVGWNCEADYFGEYCSSTCEGLDAGIGYFETNYWDNTYSGYSTTYTPSNYGSGALARYQNIYIRP